MITGASSGIGAATARAFANEGACLVLLARRNDQLKEVAAICEKSGARCEIMLTDLQDDKRVVEAVEKSIMLFGKIDVLVSNAGLGFLGAFHQQELSAVKQIIQTNLWGSLSVCHAVIPHMLNRKSGCIVNVSSVLGKRAIANLAAYCASKFGLWGFSNSLRIELKPYGINVCHFCPTATATEFQNLAGMKNPVHADTSEKVASALLDAVANGKSEHIMSLKERALIKFYLIAPQLTTNFLKLFS